MALPILSQIRNAVWASVNAYTALNTGVGKINGKFTWDDSGATLDPGHVPGIGELPALSIYQATDSSPWYTNQQQLISAAMECKLWTPELNLRRAELIWELFHLAVWDSTTGVRVRLVNQSVVQDMMMTSPAKFLRIPVSDGDGESQGSMTECTWNLTCNVLWNPRTNADLSGALTLT